MEYIIKREIFERVKLNLDGYIMWKVIDNQIIIKQVCPNKQISEFLKSQL